MRRPVVRSITKKKPFLGACRMTLRVFPSILRSARIIGCVAV
jgi:hypothetical protein